MRDFEIAVDKAARTCGSSMVSNKEVDEGEDLVAEKQELFKLTAALKSKTSSKVKDDGITLVILWSKNINRNLFWTSIDTTYTYSLN